MGLACETTDNPFHWYLTTDLSAKDCAVTLYESIRKQIVKSNVSVQWDLLQAHNHTLYKTECLSREPKKGETIKRKIRHNFFELCQYGTCNCHPCQRGSSVRAGASYFRLVRPLRTRKCEQSRGVWGIALPGKFCKIRHSEIASEAMLGPKRL